MKTNAFRLNNKIDATNESGQDAPMTLAIGESKNASPEIPMDLSDEKPDNGSKENKRIDDEKLRTK